MRNFLIGVLIFWVVNVALIIADDWKAHRGTPEASPHGRVEIVFWHAMGGPLGRVTTELIDRFNKSQDKYYVKGINMGGYDTLAKKLLASLVASEAPDISQNYETLTKKFIRHRKIVCLDDLLALETEDIKADIIPVMLANNTFDGKLFSFPFNKSVPVLYYNKDLFRQAGLDPEHPPETLEELVSMSRTITNCFLDQNQKPQVYGFGTSKANVWTFLNRLLQYGGEILSDDRRQCNFDSEAALNSLKFVQEILAENIGVEGQGFDHQNDFKAQRVAMIENSIVSKVWMEPGITFDFGVAPLPGAVRKGVILSGSNINIFNNGNKDKIQGAWEFIKWFTSTDIGAEWSVRTTYLPVRKSSVASPIMEEAFRRDRNLKAPYVQLDYCFFEPRLTVWFEIRDLIADHLEHATLEMGPPEKYLQNMTKDVNAILRHAQL